MGWPKMESQRQVNMDCPYASHHGALFIPVNLSNIIWEYLQFGPYSQYWFRINCLQGGFVRDSSMISARPISHVRECSKKLSGEPGNEAYFDFLHNITSCSVDGHFHPCDSSCWLHCREMCNHSNHNNICLPFSTVSVSFSINFCLRIRYLPINFAKNISCRHGLLASSS